MDLRTRFVGLLFALACTAFPGCQSFPFGGPGPDAQVAATVAGEPISVDELDAFVKDELFARRTSGGAPAKVYEARAEALDRLVRTRLLEAEADRRGIGVDELVETLAEALGEVSDEEIEEFYREHSEEVGDTPLEEMREPIRQYLERSRRPTAVAKFVEESEYEILLEAPRVELAADGPSRGPADAPVTIIEFSDFQCPYCRRALPIMEEVLEKYPYDVRLIYRHLPLDRIHPRARAAAEASMCADDQEAFWAYHDALFENPGQLSDEDFVRIAGEVGIDSEAFRECVASGRHRATVERDAEAAQDAGVTGTPAFFVNGILVSGAKPAPEFFELIESELERASEPDEG